MRSPRPADGASTRSGKVPSPQSLIRPMIQAIHGYTPGEQPKIKRLIKLNTNENPYPPAPKVLKAIREAVDGRLRLYPDPSAFPLRKALAGLHECKPENIVIGNGSDDILALLTRAFVEPFDGALELPVSRVPSRYLIQYLSPCYSLYPVLARIHGARVNAVPLEADFGLPSVATLKSGGAWRFDAALTFITTPNAPSGRGYSTVELENLVKAQRGLVVLDEAYVDFAPEHAMELAFKYSHVVVSRTFSKAYSLCFQRVGYAVGHPELIAALDKIRDSYNVNGLGQIAAVETVAQIPHYRRQFGRILASRESLARGLTRLGFRVLPSSTNFLLVKPPKGEASAWLDWLKERRILVRWFAAPEVRDYLRITVGSESEVVAVIRAARSILKNL